MSGYGDMPFGLSDVKFVPLPSGTVAIDLPVSRTLKFKERLVTGELKGDDAIKAVASIVEAVEWEIEAGGMSLAALAGMTGRTVTTGGTSPSGTTNLFGTAGKSFPYFKLYGKSLGETGSDDIHVKLFKAKVTSSIEGSFQNGEFFSNSIKGIAVDDGTLGIWEFVQNETAGTLPAS
jgi:hypothetical protein